MNHPHDDYSILVTLKANGTVEKAIVGSVVESLALDSDNAEQFQRLKEIFPLTVTDGFLHHYRKRI